MSNSKVKNTIYKSLPAIPYTGANPYSLKGLCVGLTCVDHRITFSRKVILLLPHQAMTYKS